MREHVSEREKLAISAWYYLNVTGELDKAAQTFQEEIESYPLKAGEYVTLGVVLSGQGQYEKAAEVARQAVRLAPDWVGGYENLANDALALQRFDEARQAIRTRRRENWMATFSMCISALLPFSARTPERWQISNGGLRANKNTSTLDWLSHPTPRRMGGILPKRGN